MCNSLHGRGEAQGGQVRPALEIARYPRRLSISLFQPEAHRIPGAAKNRCLADFF